MKIPLDAMEPHWPEISALLDDMLSLPAAERTRWMELLGEGRAHVRDTLRQLLLAQAALESDGFLLSLAPVNIVDEAERGVAPGAGDTVGPYRLISELGRGGMGSVWLAERADGTLTGRLAVKLPHAQWNRADFAHRLERERAILSKLDHPGITKLRDAGVHRSVQPYLVLDYVDGEPIDAYCQRHALDLRSRLTLFVQAADAVSYAPGRQVLHRDLKPANVLVTAKGGFGCSTSALQSCLTMDQASRLSCSGSASAAVISALSRSTIGRGMPAGPTNPHHEFTSRSVRPCSAKVGTSGRSAKRRGPVTASARNLPLASCGIGPGIEHAVDLSGQQRHIHAAAIWHMHQVDHSGPLQHLGGEVVHGAWAG